MFMIKFELKYYTTGRQCWRRTAACLALLFAVVCCGADPSIGDNAPELVCDEPVYDFGILNNTVCFEHVFVLWNRGSAPLEIQHVKSCCGVSAQLTGNKNVPPGSNTAISVKFPLDKQSGKCRKIMHVRSNDPDKPIYRLSFVGQVTALLDVNPRSLNFGCPSADSVIEHVIMLKSVVDNAFSITNVICAVSNAVVSYRSLASNVSEVVFRTVPPIQNGFTHGALSVLTDNAKFASVNIDVNITVSRDILFVPESISVKQQEGTNTVYSFVMRSRSGSNFRIVNIETPLPDIKYSVTRINDYTYRCDFHNMRSSMDIHGKHMVVSTDKKDASLIMVPVYVSPSIPEK